MKQNLTTLRSKTDAGGLKMASGISVDAAIYTLHEQIRELQTARAAPTSQWSGVGEYAAAIYRFQIGGQRDPRLNVRAASGLNETIGSDGGFLLNTDMSTRLLYSLLSANASLAGMCSMIPASSNAVSIPVIDQTSRADGSRFGGTASAWSDEAVTIGSSKPKVGSELLSLKKLVASCVTTSELVADVPALGNWLGKVFVAEFTAKLNEAIMFGNGAGQPLGIANSSATITVSKQPGQSAGTVVAANLLDMFARTPAASRLSATWFCNEATETYLARTFIPSTNLAGTENVSGSPLYIPATDDGYARILGRQVIPIENCKTLGTVGDIVLADMSCYQLAARSLSLDVSFHNRLLTDEVVWRWVWRIDGMPQWKTPVQSMHGTTLSPFVMLETR